MRLGSEGYYAARKSEEQRANFESEDHADWMRRASRMLDETDTLGAGLSGGRLVGC
jgi:hypothetical protein